MAYFLKTSKFHNDGPIGERDCEDAGSQGLDTPIQSAIATREAAIQRTSKDRFALRTLMVNQFVAANKRQPLRSEMDTILRTVNAKVGL